MRRFAFLVLLPLLGCVHRTADPKLSPLDGSSQALVVLTDAWTAVPGSLQRYERAGGGWKAVGVSIPVVVGKSGLGWGIGLHGGPAGEGPVKHEGDGRAPAGVFRIGPAFGYDPAPGGVRLPYIQVTSDWKCVDDSASAHYNEVLDQRTVTPDWNSHEEMRRRDDAYRLGAVVQHDWADQRQRAGGSCIFLHIWGGPSSSTVGCTAMAPADILSVLQWLDPDRRPVLVQLTRAEYARQRGRWSLP